MGMRSLTFKFVLIILGVSLAGIALVAILARWSTVEAFDRLLVDQARTDFISEVTTYYATAGTLTGIAAVLAPYPVGEDRPPPHPPNAAPRGSQPEVPLPQPVGPGDSPGTLPRFGLADADGRVVIPVGPFAPGQRMPAGEMQKGEPIVVDGSVIGTVIDPAIRPTRDPFEAQFLERVNQVLLFASLGAGLLAIVLGVGAARSITRPLRELTEATHSMMRGELKQEVPVRTHDELGELVTAFNNMSAEIAQADQQRRQMTADIAHDLRNPVTVILGYLEGMRDGTLAPSIERIAILCEEAQHLSSLVADLRTLSLADAGELALDVQTIVPQALLEHAAEAYRHEAERRGIALYVDVIPGLSTVDVDRDRMLQVLRNLVSNALRYTPPGGEIVLFGRRLGDSTVAIGVRDTGTGIAPETLPHIFDRFYRADAARQDKDGESGLGLAIVRSIVEAHGATIAVTSTPGAGTTFTIRIPASRNDSA